MGIQLFAPTSACRGMPERPPDGLRVLLRRPRTWVAQYAGSEHSRSEYAELISLRVLEHSPRLLALSNVRSCGSEREQSVNLGVSVVWAKVEVQSILGGLLLRDWHEQESRETIRSRSDLELFRIVVDNDPTERLSPPTPKCAGVARLDDRLLPLKGHWTSVEAPSDRGAPDRRVWALPVVIVKWTSTLAVLKKPSNLGYFFLYRLSEPPSGDQVVECPKDSMTEVKFFDVPNTNALGHIFNLKPCVEASRNTVFKSHVNMTRPVPLVSGDDRALEPTEKLAILAGQHPVGNFGELGYPHHLRISLGVLGRVQDEIKCLDSTDSPSDCDSFAPYHRCPRYICPARLDRDDFSRFPSPSRYAAAR